MFWFASWSASLPCSFRLTGAFVPLLWTPAQLPNRVRFAGTRVVTVDFRSESTYQLAGCLSWFPRDVIGDLNHLDGSSIVFSHISSHCGEFRKLLLTTSRGTAHLHASFYCHRIWQPCCESSVAGSVNTTVCRQYPKFRRFISMNISVTADVNDTLVGFIGLPLLLTWVSFVDTATTATAIKCHWTYHTSNTIAITAAVEAATRREDLFRGNLCWIHCC